MDLVFLNIHPYPYNDCRYIQIQHHNLNQFHIQQILWNTKDLDFQNNQANKYILLCG